MNQQTVEILKNISSTTQEVFLDISEKYPQIIKELDYSEFESCQEDDEGVCGRFNSDLKDLNAIIQKVESEFSSMFLSEKELVDNLATRANKVNNIEARLFDVKDLSEELKLLAMNAITASAKVGNRGGAIEIIARRLSEISTNNISATGILMEAGNKIIAANLEFHRSVQEFQTVREAILQVLNQNLKDGISHINRAVMSVFDLVNDISEQSAMTKPHLYSIMSEIQYQDIITQSIQHVVLLAEEFRPLSNFEGDSYLDEITFQLEAGDIMVDIIDDIIEKIDASVGVFKDRNSSVNQVVQDLHNMITNDVKIQLKDSGRDDSFHHLFSLSRENIERLLVEMGNLKAKRQEVRSFGKILLDSISSMTSLLEDIISSTRMIMNISFSMNLEIAKNDVLSHMIYMVKIMKDLSGNIQGKYQESLDETSITQMLIEDDFKGYMEFTDKSNLLSQRFIDDIVGGFSNLEETRGRLENELGEFDVFTNRFYTLFEGTEEKVNNLAQVSDKLKKIKSEVILQKKTLGDTLDDLFKKRNLTTWLITNDRLKDIVDKFTIYAHKKSVDSDIEEQTMESGNVSLF